MARKTQTIAAEPIPRPAQSKQTAVGTRIRVPKTAELVAAHLRRQIVKGDLVEGSALPSEAALMAQFGVSRPTLREAFRVLESEALLTVRRGARGGARVHTPDGRVAARYAALVLEHRGTTIGDILQARGVIEPPCAALLASHRTEQDLAILRKAVEAEADAEEPADAIGFHESFHHLIVELSNNRTLTVLSDMLAHIIDLVTVSSVSPEHASAAEKRAVARGHRAHERLVDLIATRQAAAAETMWRKHLLESGDYLLHGPSPRSLLDLMGPPPASGD